MALCLGFAAPQAGAQTGGGPFPTPTAIARSFTGLSPEELKVLAAGQPLIRSNAKPRVLALALENPAATRIRQRFAKLNPNYFAEFLLVLPSKEGFLSGLESLLADPRRFVGLPYYSRRQNVTYELFDKMELLGQTRDAAGERRIRVNQHMEPFDDYEAVYALRRDPGELFFSFENEGPLVYTYRNFKAAGPGDQVWMLQAFERDGFLFFYGAGGVRAFDLFGAFRERLESSFMGRIEAFFGFVMKSLS